MRDKKEIIVMKFGGTSVGDADKIRRVADRIIDSKEEGKHVVVTVSAMGDTTDRLIDLAAEITDDPSRREMDMLLSTGEQVSVAMLSMAIHKKGHRCISLTGIQAGIFTDDAYSNAKILNIKVDRVLKELKKENIVIIAGFQGSNNIGDITTLGRGGSDTTAVAIASALKADYCEIYTDVDGVYSTDPNLVKEAVKMHSLSYDEMLELASSGAGVLHLRAVEFAKKHDVVLHVRSSFNKNEGTWVMDENK
jgi:aspartate kinase